MVYKAFDIDPLDIDADGIAANQTTAGAANLVLNGAQAVDGVWDIHAIPTTAYSDGVGGVQIAIGSAGNVATVVFTVTGTDQDGIARTETITGINANSVESTLFWRTITQIAASAAVGSAVFVGAVDEIVTPTLALNWRNDYAATFVVGGVTGTLQYDIEETTSDLGAATDPTTLVWSVSQANKTADLTGSLLNYSTAARLRVDSYSSGAELQFSARQNDY